MGINRYQVQCNGNYSSANIDYVGGWERTVEIDEYLKKSLYTHHTFSLKDININNITAVDLLISAPPIYNQEKNFMACANAVTSLIDYNKQKQGDFSQVSRLFIYFNAKRIRKAYNDNRYMQISDVINGISQHGLCVEQLWNYNLDKIDMMPLKICYKQKNNDIIFCKITKSMDQLKSCLALGKPFVFGFDAYMNICNIVVGKYVLNLPKTEDKYIGGHTVSCFGFSDELRAFLCRNSVGTNFGNKGYFWMSYDYVLSDKTSEFWTIL